MTGTNMDLSSERLSMSAGGAGAATRLSVCVVSFNTRDYLRDCLNSVFEQTPGVALEVIVVDNASSDGSAEMVAREFPRVRLIANRENRRFAIGNNQALREARGEYLLLLNSDTVVLDRALVKMVEFMDANNGVGALGCRLVARDGAPTRSFGVFPSLMVVVAFSSGPARRLMRSTVAKANGVPSGECRGPVDVDWPSGACLMTRRRALDEVGLLDESFLFYGEEVDFCWRLKARGWRRMLLPVSVVHLGGSSGTVDAARLGRCNTVADWRVVWKHRSLPYRWLYIACDLLSLLCRTLTALLKRLLRRSGARELSDALEYAGAVLRVWWTGEYRRYASEASAENTVENHP